MAKNEQLNDFTDAQLRTELKARKDQELTNRRATNIKKANGMALRIEVLRELKDAGLLSDPGYLLEENGHLERLYRELDNCWTPSDLEDTYMGLVLETWETPGDEDS